MVSDAGNADEPASGNENVEGGPLPQPDPASLTPPEPDAAELARDAQAAAEAERPFLEAKEALKNQLHLGPEWGPRQAAREGGRYGLGNIVGVGIAEKEVDGRPVGTLAVTVYVIAKAPAYMVAPEALVPERINGLPTDVVESGEERPLALTGKYRPVPAGVSIGPKPWIDSNGVSWVTRGTAGCLLERDSAIHVLSNHHVLLNPTGSTVGDPIYQPSLYDGGVISTDQIAALSYWVTLTSGVNYVDCAMARVDDRSLVTPKIECLAGTAWFTSSWLACRRGRTVYKCGLATGLTFGIIWDCHRAGWANGYWFEEQILIRPWSTTAFAASGDSGAVVFRTDDYYRARPVGLLRSIACPGVGPCWGVASPFGLVLSGLGATMAFGLP